MPYPLVVVLGSKFGVVVLRVGYGMRGWSVLGSVLLVGSGALGWSLLMARWINSIAYLHYFLHIEL